MTGTEYVERVLSVMRHVTPSEREAIRAELAAHIEDHICDLLELDYDETLAEERTMALMGDPEEVGRELDKHYKFTLFDVMELVSTLLIVVIVFQALLGIGILFHAVDAVEARFAPPQRSSGDFTAEATEETGYRVTIGNDILEVYQVSVGNKVFAYYSHNQIAEQGLAAEVLVCAYDRIPFGIVSGDLTAYLRVEDQRGTELESWGHSAGSWGAVYEQFYIPLEPGDTYVTLSYDRFGESVELKVPLPEVTS